MKKFKENFHNEYSELKVDKILDGFNEKFSYIYKYISKELGPVALNTIEKCLEETKSYLSPLLQEIKVTSSGRIDMSPIFKTNLIFSSKKTQMNLIKDLNEILVAEVLAVKKNLGNEHESVVVKNLKKIGEKN